MIRLAEIYKNLLVESGGISISLEMYRVSCDTETDSKIIYEGPDLKKAEGEYNSDPFFDKSDLVYDHTMILYKKTDVYEFIGDDSVEEYPIAEYYDNSNYYELKIDGEYEDVKSRVISRANKDSDELLYDVDRYYNSEYGGWKYHKIKVTDVDGYGIGYISLRIADHSENINNHDRFDDADYYISVVIANYDQTRNRFGMMNSLEGRSNEYEFHFGAGDDLGEITQNIDDKITEFSDRIKVDNESK